MLYTCNSSLKKARKLNLDNAKFHQAIKGHVQKALAQFGAYKSKSSKLVSSKDMYIA